MAKVTMPQLGESVAEGTIGRWLKQPGDTVAKYEPLLEVITDKVNAEVPSPFAGVLKEILAEEGAVVPNDAEIAVIETEDEALAGGTEAPARRSRSRRRPTPPPEGTVGRRAAPRPRMRRRHPPPDPPAPTSAPPQRAAAAPTPQPPAAAPRRNGRRGACRGRRAGRGPPTATPTPA